MRRLAVVVLAVLAVGACSSGSTHTADRVAACKAAMTRDYRYALAHPDAPPAGKPGACKGVPDATIRKLAAEIMASG